MIAYPVEKEVSSLTYRQNQVTKNNSSTNDHDTISPIFFATYIVPYLGDCSTVNQG